MSCAAPAAALPAWAAAFCVIGAETWFSCGETPRAMPCSLSRVCIAIMSRAYRRTSAFRVSERTAWLVMISPSLDIIATRRISGSLRVVSIAPIGRFIGPGIPAVLHADGEMAARERGRWGGPWPG